MSIHFGVSRPEFSRTQSLAVSISNQIVEPKSLQICIFSANMSFSGLKVEYFPKALSLTWMRRSMSAWTGLRHLPQPPVHELSGLSLSWSSPECQKLLRQVEIDKGRSGLCCHDMSLSGPFHVPFHALDSSDCSLIRTSSSWLPHIVPHSNQALLGLSTVFSKEMTSTPRRKSMQRNKSE